MVKCWNVLVQKPQKEYSDTDIQLSFPTTVERMVTHFEFNNFKIEDLQDSSLKQKIREEARLYFKNGSCHMENVRTVCLNPTMLNPTSQRWNVHYALCPFDGYLPFSNEGLDTSIKNGMLIRACQKKLKSLVLSYRNRKDDIKIFFHLEDALEFCYAGTTDMFDIIDCSNLADHVGLVNLINAASTRLSDAPRAVLITESMNWRSLAPSVIQYLEEALCVPSSMFPTIYGLRLVNHFELGVSKLVNLQKLTGEPVTLCWEKSPSFRNVALQFSPTLVRCLEQLARKCFVVQDSRKKLMAGDIPEKCGILCYTPLAFNYIVDSMKQRVGGDDWLTTAFDKLNISSAFLLSQRTTEAWKKGQKILKLSTEVNLNSSNPLDVSAMCYQRAKCAFGTPVLRLVFVPHTMLMYGVFQGFGQAKPLWGNIQNGFSAPDVHYFENVQLDVKTYADGEIETVSISFLMIPDHGLEETHFAYVLDLMTGLPVFFIQSFEFFQVEKCRLSYPIQPNESHLPLAPPSSQMAVESCCESHDQYILKISIGCNENVSGK